MRGGFLTFYCHESPPIALADLAAAVDHNPVATRIYSLFFVHSTCPKHGFWRTTNCCGAHIPILAALAHYFLNVARRRQFPQTKRGFHAVRHEKATVFPTIKLARCARLACFLCYEPGMTGRAKAMHRGSRRQMPCQPVAPQRRPLQTPTTFARLAGHERAQIGPAAQRTIGSRLRLVSHPLALSAHLKPRICGAVPSCARRMA